MSTVKERLIAYLKYKKVSFSEFGKTIGVSNAYVTSMRKSIQPDKVKSIALNYPDLNIDWLLTDVGSMLKTDEAAETDTPTGLTAGVPLIPIEAIAGIPADNDISVMFEDCELYHIPEFERLNVEYLIRVSGSSMYPKYSNGDLLACRRVRDILFFQWGKVYVIDSSQGALVKRVFPDEKNEDYIMLVSDNKEKYPPFSIPKSDIRSLSIVAGVFRIE